RVLAAVLDDRQADAGAGARVGEHVVGRDALGVQERAELLAKGVVAQPADDADLGAGPARGDGLVEALAADEGLEAAADHGLAGARSHRGGDDEVVHEGRQHAHPRRGVGGRGAGGRGAHRAAPSWAPSEPPGCRWAKSAGVKPLSVISAAASASPIASVTVAEEVGASPSGSASRSTRMSRWTSHSSASVEEGSRVIAIRGTPHACSIRAKWLTSAVSPELEMRIATSAGVAVPESPCSASVACTNCAGVPVEASVAATLAPMCPDFPRPETS